MLRIFLLSTLLVPFAVMAETLEFVQGSNKLVGEYHAASSGTQTRGVILFVHGDGASRYDADGYFDIIWDQLRDKGYAVFSWDKPGVGRSSGNWLNQSMQDRQEEVEAAIKVVQAQYGYSAKNTGLIGFSQAGWVVPDIAKNNQQIGFLIGIGFARNWVDQGRYHSVQKHASDLLSLQSKEEVVEEYDQAIELFRSQPSYDTYLKETDSYPMEKDRYGFVLRNYRADSSQQLSMIKVPTLLLWGAHDQNVDAKSEYAWVEQNPNPYITGHLIADGTHSLLNHYLFPNRELGLKDWLKMVLYEEDAFADKFFPTVLGWLDIRESLRE